MRQVALLDPLVAQRVAAGAVLDRLTSGVKELSGNTLDADVARTEVGLVDSRNALMIVLEEVGKLLSRWGLVLMSLAGDFSQFHLPAFCGEDDLD